MKTIKTLIYVVLGIVILILGLVFCLANMTPVTLKFYHFETVPIPLWFLVIVSMLAGAVLTVILITLDLYRGARKLSNLKKELKSIEKKFNSLKEEKKALEHEKKCLLEAREEEKDETSPDTESTSEETKSPDPDDRESDVSV